MFFPPAFVERLRNHLPISEVIARRMPLKRHGREFQGLCPFHREKSPSFTVNDEKGFYHCFGCNAHGDAIGFIKEFEKISYPEAIERLAGEAGLALPVMTHHEQSVEREQHSLQEICAKAASWFSHQLQGAGGKEARDYLESRGITSETIEQFQIGFSPLPREALKTAAIKEGIPENLLLEAGLLARTQEGSTYDRFRGRVMFPIRNGQGKVVAFGGRILPSASAQSGAKYLNSPETPLFKKGELLFNYDKARRTASPDAPLLVVEGYMDAIMLYQAGLTTAVAPLGTAVTPQQLQLMWRIYPEPVMCLDADAAGARAMLRTAELALPLLKPGSSLRFARLPHGEDPDSMVRRAGVSALKQVIAQAPVLSDALWHQSVNHYGYETPEKKSALEQHVMQLTQQIADPVVKQHMRDYFKQELYKLRTPYIPGKRQGKTGKSAAYTPTDPKLGVLPAVHDDASHFRRIEALFAAIILSCPVLLHQAQVEEFWGHMDFHDRTLDKFRSVTLEVTGTMEMTDSSAFAETLKQKGLDETVEYLLQLASRHLPPHLDSNEPAALHAWQLAAMDHSLISLRQEKRLADEAFAQDVSQAHLERVQMLQKNIDELERNRYLLDSIDEQLL